MDKLIIDPSRVKDNAFVDANTPDRDVRTAILMAQNAKLQPFLGVVMYKKIITEGSDINDDYKLLMNEYVLDLLVFYSIESLVDLKFASIGTATISKDERENQTSLAMSEVNKLQEIVKQYTSSYENMAMNFMLEHADKYPEHWETFGNSSEIGSIHEQTEAIFNLSLVKDRQLTIREHDVMYH